MYCAVLCCTTIFFVVTNNSFPIITLPYSLIKWSGYTLSHHLYIFNCRWSMSIVGDVTHVDIIDDLDDAVKMIGHYNVFTQIYVIALI